MVAGARTWKLLLMLVAAAGLLIARPDAARAQDVPADFGVFLVPAPEAPHGVNVVLRWRGVADEQASYEVWRRTAPDHPFQETEKYATVPAAARGADDMFEFIDPEPFSRADRPCYMVAPTRGLPPDRFTLDACIPTLPDAMAGLKLTALPGPDANTWYVDGSGFAPGAAVVVSELTCPGLPCYGTGATDPPLRASSEGRISAYLVLGEPPGGSTRTIVAFESGWLQQQFSQAPSVTVPASHGGVGLGYPQGTRTGIADVDRVIDLTQAGDTDGLRALLLLKEGRRFSGEQVRGLASWQCVESIRDEQSLGQFFEYPGGLVYAVFRIPPGAGTGLRFEGAEYGVVWSEGAGGLIPLGGLTLVGGGRIVGQELRCGTTPAFHLRGFSDFVLAPWTGQAPGSPAVGNGLRASPGNLSSGVGLALVLVAVVALLAEPVLRRRAAGWKR